MRDRRRARSGAKVLAGAWLVALAACSSGGAGSSAGSGGAGGDRNAATGGVANDAASDSGGGAEAAGDAGTPITAAAGQWTWVSFPDAHCASGSTVGIGINPGQANARVLIYLEGGGACWTETTCYVLQTAANFNTGYSATTFALEAANPAYLAQPGGFFDRTASSNPFKDASYVYVPYCTGDLHAGNNVMQYGTHTAMHVGAQNVTAYLRRLVPTFQGTDRVYLAGSSAGGYGALINWWRVQQAFGGVRVDMIDDSGTPMPPDIVAVGNGAEPMWRTAWNLGAALPPDCAACATRLDGLLGYYAQTFPQQRGALLSYAKDTTLPNYLGITGAQFTTGLDEEVATNLAPSMNLRSFIVGAAGHVLWFAQPPPPSQQFGMLQTFLQLMTTDAPGWASVQP